MQSLKENAIPIELARAELVNQPLTRDLKPTWKSYGEVHADKQSKTRQQLRNLLPVRSVNGSNF